MKKNILVFGLISGLIISTFMAFSTAYCYNTADYDSSMLLGYASMVVAFSFIFVGVKNFRDKLNQGAISFGQAFKMGLLITLVSSTMYVIVWAVEYYYFIPDFMDSYIAHTLKEAEAGGASSAEIEQKVTEMDMYKEWYKNPVLVVLLTYSEVFPIGLIISVITALLLKRKPQQTE